MTAGAGGDAELERWLAELRVDDAARARARIGHLRSGEAQDSTLVGVLVTLGERGGPVTVTTTSGARHRGRVRLVGPDSVVLGQDRGRWLVLRLGALAAVRAPAPAVSGADRHPTTGASLARVLAAVAEPGERLRVVAGPEVVTGEVEAVGADVVAIRLEGGDRSYVAVTSVDEASPVVAGGRA